MQMTIWPALGSARKSPSFSPIRSSQVLTAEGAASFAVHFAERGHRLLHLNQLLTIFRVHVPPGLDARFFEYLSMGREILGGSPLGLASFHQARGFAGAFSARAKRRFDQRPVQFFFGFG